MSNKSIFKKVNKGWSELNDGSSSPGEETENARGLRELRKRKEQKSRRKASPRMSSDSDNSAAGKPKTPASRLKGSSSDEIEEEMHYRNAFGAGARARAVKFDSAHDFPSKDPHQEREMVRRYRAKLRTLLLAGGEAETALWARLRAMDPGRTGLVAARHFREAAAQAAPGRLALEEMGWLVAQLQTRGGRVAYMELPRALGPRRSDWRGAPGRWEEGSEEEDGSGEEGEGGRGGGAARESALRRRGLLRQEALAGEPDGEGWARRHGSLGEWLGAVASPLERKHFCEFVRTLEEFEQKRGLDPATRESPFLGDDSVVIRLGPNLNARIDFFVSPS